jgi:hypothetical protein
LVRFFHFTYATSERHAGNSNSLATHSRYPLLFSGLLKNTPHDHPDFTVLQKALEQLQKVANDVNEFSKKKDNDDKLFELSLRMQDFPETLNIPGRLFLSEREIDIQVNDSSEKSKFYVRVYRKPLHNTSQPDSPPSVSIAGCPV